VKVLFAVFHSRLHFIHKTLAADHSFFELNRAKRLGIETEANSCCVVEQVQQIYEQQVSALNVGKLVRLVGMICGFLYKTIE
jgi:hypothetical protein